MVLVSSVPAKLRCSTGVGSTYGCHCCWILRPEQNNRSGVDTWATSWTPARRTYQGASHSIQS
ncbi:hypothetical protein RchiOBHm_Chr4g0422641 [Rosa chinensis]|uniref:Uncharacterized protein n=1 Tax=Rosa chinensis TaxID=74649 RepID=A0A2P6QYF1_ROSCH|nr:hypothetical protein RchiOBHm_Chr4g0422641 [Rosa chinensis]